MRYLLLGLLSCLLGTLLTAQTTFGIRGGAGQSGLGAGQTFDVVTDQTDRLGTYSVGVFADLPLGEYVSLRPGLEYSQRGTSVGLTQGVALFGVKLPVGARARTRFNYVDVPLLLQLQLPTDSRFKPYAIAGPTVGYALGGELRTSARALIDVTLSRTDIDLAAINYERLHVALQLGAGTQVELGGGTAVFVEGRYEHGLTQPYNVPLVRDGVGFRGWNVGAGLRLAL